MSFEEPPQADRAGSSGRAKTPPMRAGPGRVILGTAGDRAHGRTTLVQALAASAERPFDAAATGEGSTLDLGFTPHRIGGLDVGVVDLPGHEHRLALLLTRLCAVDLVLFVVAADQGLTNAARDQLEGLLDLHDRPIVFAVSRADLVEPQQIAQLFETLREATAGTEAARHPPIVISTLTGVGIGELGQTLARIGARLRPRERGTHFRMPIDRGFVIAGRGLTGVGTLLAGSVRVGMSVTVSGGATSRVASLLALGQPVTEAQAGQRLMLGLPDLAPGDLTSGRWLAEPGFGRVTERFDAFVEAGRRVVNGLRSFTKVRFVFAAAEVPAEVILLGGQAKLAPAESGFCQIALERSVMACAGDRFVLVADPGGQMLGHGEILQPFANRHQAEGQAALPHLQSLRERQGSERVLPFLKLLTKAVVPIDFVAQALDLSSDALLEAIYATTDVVLLPDRQAPFALITSEKWAQLISHIESTILTYLASHPRKSTIDSETLRSRLRIPVDRDFFDIVLDKLQAAGVLVELEEKKFRYAEIIKAGKEITVVLGIPDQEQGKPESSTMGPRELALAPRNPGPGNEPPQPAAADDEHLLETFATEITVAGMAPPGVAQLAASRDVSGPQRLRLLRLLVERGILVEIEDGLFFSPVAIAQAETCVLECLQSTPTLTAAEFRDRIGASRRHALALLAHFDGMGLTVRDGDSRRRA